MTRLEEIVYDAGQRALADQESLVSGVRQRTGTLLAAHALVASFLGAAVIRAQGLEWLGWVAVSALVLGLCVAAVILAPWSMTFAVDARELYTQLFQQAAEEAEHDTLGWLAGAAITHQLLREENQQKVTRMSRLSAALGILMVGQTVAWLLALALN